MATPITWRNVSGSTGGSEAAALLRGTQASMDGAFTNLDKILKERQANNIANAGVVEENQKQAFLNLMAGAKTPDQLAAMQGEIDAAYGGMSAANQAATRDAQAARLATIQGRVVQDRQFQQGETDARNKPLLDQAMAAAAAGDGLGVAAIESANPGLPIAEARKTLVSAGRAQTADQYAADKNAREAVTAPLDDAYKKAQTAVLDANAKNIPVEAAAKARENLLRQHGIVTKQIEEDSAKLGKMETSSISSKGAWGEIFKTMEDAGGDKAQVARTKEVLSTVVASNPAYASLPKEVVQTIGLRNITNKSMLWGTSNPAGNIKAALDEAVLENRGGTTAQEAGRAALVESLNANRVVAANLLDQISPEVAAKRLAIKEEEARKGAAGAAGTPQGNTGTTPTDAPKGQPVVTPAMVKKEEDGLAERRLELDQREVSLGLRKEISKESQDFLVDKQKREDAGVRAFMERMGAAAKTFSPVGDAMAAPGAALANLVGANRGDPSSLISRAVGGVSLRDAQVAKVQADRKNLEKILADSQTKKAK